MSRYGPNLALHSARLARGWSTEVLADRITIRAEELGGRFAAIRVDGRSVRRWESGERWPWPLYVELLCQVFQASPEELGMVKRRDFLRLAASMPGLGLVADPERLGHVLSQLQPVDVQALDDLEAVTRDLVHRHRATAPRNLTPHVLAHLNHLKGLQALAPAQLAPRLQVTIGEVAILAGWLAWFGDNRGDAGSWWRHAAQLARAAHDRNLEAHALVAFSALHSTQGWRPEADTHEAIRLLDRALELAGPGPTRLRGWVLDRRAEEYAIAGRSADALDDLAMGDRIIATVQAESGTYAGSRDATHQLAYRGNVAVHLGDGPAAADNLRRVLAGTPARYLTARCWSLMDLTVAEALQEHPEAAARALSEALEVAERLQLAAYSARIRRIRNLNLARWSGHPCIGQLDQRLQSKI